MKNLMKVQECIKLWLIIKRTSIVMTVETYLYRRFFSGKNNHGNWIELFHRELLILKSFSANLKFPFRIFLCFKKSQKKFFFSLNAKNYYKCLCCVMYTNNPKLITQFSQPYYQHQNEKHFPHFLPKSKWK